MSEVVVKKAFWKSKTLWVGFFTILYGVMPFFGIDVEGAVVAQVTGILFTVLRFVTGVSIGFEDIKKAE